MKIEDLNLPEQIDQVDREGMLKVIESFPEQCREALAIAEQAEVAAPSAVSSVVILGMGGSGIGGSMIKVLLEREIRVPISVVKGYELPAFVDEKALVFAVSYSGDTEETLATFEEARLRRRANVVAITSNGRLKERATEEGLSLIEIPTGYQPRAALGYLFLPILVILGKAGLVSDKTESIEEAIEILKVESSRFAVKTPAGQNDAKRLAAELYGKIPIIYGAEGISSAAALRWKTQFHENSKIPAFYNVFSELNHNEIVGWEMLEEQTQMFDLIVLRHAGEYGRNKKRIEITLPMISDHLYSVREVWAEGESDVARLLSLIYIGDFTSAYLAILYGVDPTPVERIKLLKEKLQQGNVEADL